MDDLLTTKQAAAALRMSLSTFNRQRRRDANFPTPIRNAERHLWWNRDQLNEWLKTRNL